MIHEKPKKDYYDRLCSRIRTSLIVAGEVAQAMEQIRDRQLFRGGENLSPGDFKDFVRYDYEISRGLPCIRDGAAALKAMWNGQFYTIGGYSDMEAFSLGECKAPLQIIQDMLFLGENDDAEGPADA